MNKNLVRFGLPFFAAALLLILGAGPATAATDTFRSLENISIFVPCANGGAGELVEGVVRRHVVVGVTEDGAGGFHLHASLQDRGALLGTVTGDTYRLHADVPAMFEDRVNITAGGVFNASFNFSVDVIGTGDAPTFSVDGHAQITVNANGDVVMEKGDFTLNETCN